MTAWTNDWGAGMAFGILGHHQPGERDDHPTSILLLRIALIGNSGIQLA
jgi:hypothetical protein